MSRQHLSVRVAGVLVEKVKDNASIEHRNVSQMIEVILIRYFDSLEAKKEAPKNENS